MSDNTIFKHIRMGCLGFGLGFVGGIYLRGRKFGMYKWQAQLINY